MEPPTTCTPSCPVKSPTPTHTNCRCSDPRLGPTALPTQPRIVSQMLKGYDRFGGLGPEQYLNEWANAPNGKYRNPPGDGFTIDNCGNEKRNGTLFKSGMLLDRVGAPDGKYLAPICDPMPNRSIPPRNLCDTGSGVYHVFEVCSNFWADLGNARPWFNQPGNGKHITLPDGLSTENLVNNKTLRRLGPAEVAQLTCPIKDFKRKC
jgi:hypothetical protein